MYWEFLRHHKCNKCQSLYDGTSYCALPVHYTFSDFDIISRSQQCQTVLILLLVLTEDVIFLCDQVETL